MVYVFGYLIFHLCCGYISWRLYQTYFLREHRELYDREEPLSRHYTIFRFSDFVVNIGPGPFALPASYFALEYGKHGIVWHPIFTLEQARKYVWKEKSLA